MRVKYSIKGLLIISVCMLMFADVSAGVITGMKAPDGSGWCWAVSIRCISKFYDKEFDLCSIVNEVCRMNYPLDPYVCIPVTGCGCCNSSTCYGMSPCSWVEFASILRDWTLNNTPLEGWPNTVMSTLEAHAGSNPIIAGFGVSSVGHVVVIKNANASSNIITVMDPFDGEFHYPTYEQFSCGLIDDRDYPAWSVTYLMTSYTEGLLAADLVITFLSYFTPYLNGNGVTIDFETSFEKNTNHYLLQKSSTGYGNFETIALIEARGAKTKYSYTDRGGLFNDFYRLVEVEYSGEQHILENSGVFNRNNELEFVDTKTRRRDLTSIRNETSDILNKNRNFLKAPMAAVEENSYEWVAIYPDSFKNDIDSLRAWREMRGLTTYGISIDSVESGYGNINTYINSLWENQNGSLEYVCLVGGADSFGYYSSHELIPIDIFSDGAPDYETDYTSDFEVGDIDGDGYPEVAVGRIPAEEIYDVASYVNKVLKYEDPDSVSNNWDENITYFIDAMTHNSSSGPIAKYYSEDLMEYLPGNYNLNYMLFNDSTYIDSINYPPSGLDYCQTTKLAVNEINEGRSLVLGYGNAGNQWNVANWMIGHPFGGDCWGHYFSIDSLTTNEIFPFLIGASCHIGLLSYTDRDDVPRPIIKELMFDSERGIIGAFAPSGSSWLSGNYKVSKNLLQYLYEWGSPSLGYACMSAQKMVVLENDFNESTARSYIFYGDPAIKLVGSLYDDDGTAYCDIFHSYYNEKDFLLVCPEGDAEEMILNLDFYFDFNQVSIPADSITLEVSSLDSTLSIFNSESIVADSAATDENSYHTTIRHGSFGGYGNCNFNVLLEGESVGYYGVTFRSPDINADGNVNLADLGLFGPSYNTCEGDSLYLYYCNFNADTCCNLSDYSFMGEHYLHKQEDYIKAMSYGDITYSDLRVILNLEQYNKENNSCKLFVNLENANSVTDICFAIVTNIGSLKYLKFSNSNEFNGRIISAPIERDNRELILIYVSNGEKPFSNSVELGSVEFINTEKEIENFASEDFALYFGEAMNNDGLISNIKGIEINGSTEITPVYRTYLGRNYPNPFNPSTTIEYSLASNTHISLKIYNVNGQLIKTLVDEMKVTGNYKAVWDGKNNNGKSVASGVYFYKMKTKQYTETKKMVLLR